jgi:hypothetical protein
MLALGLELSDDDMLGLALTDELIEGLADIEDDADDDLEDDTDEEIDGLADILLDNDDDREELILDDKLDDRLAETDEVLTA